MRFIGPAAALLLAFASQAAERVGQYAIYRSVDRGRSWTRSDHGLPGSSRVNAFVALGDLVFAGTDSGIYRSMDDGLTWKPSLGSARVISFAVSDSVMYAGTDGSGVFVSTDKGARWSVNLSFPSKKARSLLAHKGRVYAGTETEGVLVTSNGGQSWSSLGDGLPPQAQIFGLTMSTETLFAALYGKGLYAWSDREQHWTKMGDVVPLVLTAVDGSLIAGHNPGGVFWSEDLGATWAKGTGGMDGNAPIWEAGSGDGIAFAGAASAIYFSEDRGHTWVATTKGLPPESPGVSFLVKRNLILAGVIVKK